ncbi:MAG: hypothetical protein MUP55_00995 [Candidatus Aenigmarchaeota archaeon]|nr:hypothetical protein [Candidatus Aenigmarchaeota archaeon]
MDDKRTIKMFGTQEGWEGYKFWCSNCKKVIGQSVIPYIKCPRCGEKTVSIYNEQDKV